MGGKGSGTGSPFFFRCSKCRRWGKVWRGMGSGYVDRVELTGRTRKYRGNLEQRMTNVSREYRCLDCGHVGWSRHVDLVCLTQRGEP